MTQQYGSPNENDDIARVERGIESVVQRKAQHFESVVDRLAPRAIGSQKVPREQEFAEYLMTLASAPDPVEAGTQWVQEKASQYGLLKALDMFASYVATNEKALQEYGAAPSSEAAYKSDTGASPEGSGTY